MRRQIVSGRREKDRESDVSSSQKPAAPTSTSFFARCVSSAATSAASIPPIEWPTRLALGMSKLVHQLMVKQRRVDNVVDMFAAGRFAEARQMRRV